ncbi:MoaD/ThiS family protein [Bacillus spongiae]|uniref:Molybdopterin synthase sulfur carrier subunit n=1 Tax=Bacillus spongiae TaxID=2683610 RepID=A0ABU8HFX8_9BACI
MIKLLLFSHLQEAVGKPELIIDKNEITVIELKCWLQEQYEGIQLRGVMSAINEEYAEDQDKICSGDIVALIPPVSGG